MAYSRRLGADDGVLIGCSICGNAFMYPSEIRRCSDRLFRCNRFCTETENLQDYNDKQQTARARIKDEATPPFTGAPKPGIFE